MAIKLCNYKDHADYLPILDKCFASQNSSYMIISAGNWKKMRDISKGTHYSLTEQPKTVINWLTM